MFVRAWLVAALMIVTMTPGITPPVSSPTLPETLAVDVPPCASARCGATTATARDTTASQQDDRCRKRICVLLRRRRTGDGYERGIILRAHDADLVQPTAATRARRVRQLNAWSRRAWRGNRLVGSPRLLSDTA